jgi:hypothetical protein
MAENVRSLAAQLTDTLPVTEPSRREVAELATEPANEGSREVDFTKSSEEEEVLEKEKGWLRVTKCGGAQPMMCLFHIFNIADKNGTRARLGELVRILAQPGRYQPCRMFPE